MIKAAYRIAREIGLKGNYDNNDNASLATQNLFLNLARLVHLNDENAARFIVYTIGLESLGEALKRINHHTVLGQGNGAVLVPKIQAARIADKLGEMEHTLERVHPLMRQHGYELQTYMGMHVYSRINRKLH